MDKLTSLHQFLEYIVSADKLETIFSITQDELIRTLHPDGIVLFLADTEGHLRAQTSYGFTDVELIAPDCWADKTTPLRSIWVTHAKKNHLDPNLAGVHLPQGMQACGIVPAIADSRLIAVISLYFKHSHVFTERVKMLTEMIAVLLAMGLKAHINANTTRHNNELFNQVTEHIHEVLWVRDITNNAPLYVSAAYEKIWGRSLASLHADPKSWLDTIHPDDKQLALNAITSRQVHSAYQAEYRIIRPDGAILWIRHIGYPVKDIHGEVYRVVGIAEDISERKHMEQQLENLAHYDVLTGLPNRALLFDRIMVALAYAKTLKTKLAICLLDLDGFKQINDTYGHAAGDALLVEAAVRMQNIFRSTDTIARLGGDEFVIVISNLNDETECETLMFRLLQAIEQPFLIHNTLMRVSASIGITICPNDASTPENLLLHADQAMYLAKKSGRNQFQFFHPDNAIVIRNTHEFAISLERALQMHQFVLHYQPQVNMHTGQVFGLESLIRWQHPERGLLFPKEFLPAIEDSAFEMALSKWVIDHVITQMAQWEQQGLSIRVSINLPTSHLQQADGCAQFVHQALQQHPPTLGQRLNFEILETVPLKNLDACFKTITACAMQGINFTIDDFGTGYGSLSYLKDLPINTIKIDQTFVQDMFEDVYSLSIIESVIHLAQSAQKTVIAEGVETMDRGIMLLHLGCQLAQGYFISAPMPAEEVFQWVEAYQAPTEWLTIPLPVQINYWRAELAMAEITYRHAVARLINQIKKQPHVGTYTQIAQERFIQWLHHDGKRTYAHSAEFVALETSHLDLLNYANILLQTSPHDDKQSSACVTELLTKQTRFIEALHQLLALIPIS